MQSRFRQHLNPIGLALLLATVVVLALTAGGGRGGAGDTSFLERLAERDANVSRDRAYNSVAGAAAAADAVVTGRFVDVVPGRGFSWTFTDAGEEIRHEHAYDSPEAWVNTVHATLRVADASRSAARNSIKGSDLITVGFTVEPGLPADQVARELGALGDVVVLLKSTPVFGYQPGVYGVLEDGGFVGRIDAAGAADFMLFAPGEFGPTRTPVRDLIARN